MLVAPTLAKLSQFQPEDPPALPVPLMVITVLPPIDPAVWPMLVMAVLAVMDAENTRVRPSSMKTTGE